MSTTHRGSCSCDCDTEASSLRRFLAGSNTRQIVEFTPLRPMHCYLVRIADAGSVPCSTTSNTCNDPLFAFRSTPLRSTAGGVFQFSLRTSPPTAGPVLGTSSSFFLSLSLLPADAQTTKSARLTHSKSTTYACRQPSISFRASGGIAKTARERIASSLRSRLCFARKTAEKES